MLIVETGQEIAGMIVARHLVIQGRVQGVFYRGWAVETARALGLQGWVRNRRDGAVEAIIQGDEPSVERFIDLAHDGSKSAEVRAIETTLREPDRTIVGFIQYPTA